MAEIVLNERDLELLSYVGFHCQQCIEKALKGFLVECKVQFLKKHELLYALDLCLSVDPDFESLAEELAVLEPYAVDVRYPADLPETPTIEQAQASVALCRRVIDFVEKKLAAKDEPLTE